MKKAASVCLTAMLLSIPPSGAETTEAAEARGESEGRVSNTALLPPLPPVISVADFGAVPNDGKDDRTAIMAAASMARRTPGATLLIPPGIYNIRSEQGIKLLDDLITGRANANRVQAIRYPEFLIGLDFSGLKNITIEATGAELTCEGMMEPVGLYNCHGVTLKGLTISYLRSPQSFGTITHADNDSYDVAFDADCPVGKDFAAFRVMSIHPLTGRLVILPCPRSELIAPNVRRFNGPMDPAMKGANIGYAHVAFYRPAIMIHESAATTLKQVTILDHGGPGVLAYLCNGLTFDGLFVVPKPGRAMSVSADSTHLTSCAGEIRMEGCQFSGAGDDATNVHGYYYEISAPLAAKTHDLTLNHIDWGNTHPGRVDAPLVGDKLALVDADTTQELDTFTVTGVKIDPKKWRAEVSFDRELPADATQRRMINLTRMPRVVIRNGSVFNQRARGFLIKTGPVLIENCLFFQTTGHAIQCGSETWWSEGHAVHDVVIRHNRFINCGYGEGNFNDASCIDVFSNSNTPLPGSNKRILIEDNLCEAPGSHAIVVDSAESVTIRRNRITGAKEPIYVRHSTDVKVYDNFGANLTVGPGCQTSSR